MNLENVVLSDRSQKKRLEIGEEGGRMGICLEFLFGIENVIKLDCDDGCISLNILKTTELYTLKWVNFMICEYVSVKL